MWAREYEIREKGKRKGETNNEENEKNERKGRVIEKKRNEKLIKEKYKKLIKE